MARQKENQGLELLEMSGDRGGKGGRGRERQPPANGGVQGNYRITRPDGSILYTDMPDGPGQVESVDASREPSDSGLSYPELRSAIRKTQKHVPKLNEYVEEAEYVGKNYRFWRWEKELQALKNQKPALWLKLQQDPRFQSITRTLFGWKSGEKNLTAAMRTAMGDLQGAAGGWVDGSAKEMMKRDGYGSHAGQGAGRAGSQGTAAAVTRAGAARAATRVMGPIVDVGAGALDVDTAKGVQPFVSRGYAKERARQFVQDKVLNGLEADLYTDYYTRGMAEEAEALVQEGLRRQQEGGNPDQGW